MQGLLACFAALCLTLVSGTPSDDGSRVLPKSFNYDNVRSATPFWKDEMVASGAFPVDESRVYSKSFNFGDKEVLYPKRPFTKGEMLYAACEGRGIAKWCKVYVESTHQDRNIVQSCDLNLRYREMFNFDVALFNAGNSKAVFAVKDGPTRIRLINVKLKGCQIEETGVDVPMQLTREAEHPIEVIVITYENKYDVIYQNEDLCGAYLCKATFDYEGRVVRPPASFGIRSYDLTSFQIVSNDYVYLVTKLFGQTSSIYLIDDYEMLGRRSISTKTSVNLFSGPRGVFGLSTEENKLGFCMYGEQKLVCRQYDAEGKTKINEVEVTGTRRLGILFLDVLNLERGLLVVSVEQDVDNNRRNIFVAHFDERGAMGKFVEVHHRCDRPKMVLPKLYKNSYGEYCVSSLCAAPLDKRENAVFSRNTRCFNWAELF